MSRVDEPTGEIEAPEVNAAVGLSWDEAEVVVGRLMTAHLDDLAWLLWEDVPELPEESFEMLGDVARSLIAWMRWRCDVRRRNLVAPPSSSRCPECGGSGSVEEPWAGGMKVFCPICGGSGEPPASDSSRNLDSDTSNPSPNAGGAE